MPDAREEEVIIVDRENNIVGSAPRSVMRAKRLPHRATYCLVFSSKGEIFVQKRTSQKDIYPSHWEIAAGGVVSKGETYEASAKRELEEELGIRGVDLEPLFDFSFEDEENFVWGRAFRCVYDGELTFQKEEVEMGMFLSVDALIKMIEKERFTPDSIYLLGLLREKGVISPSRPVSY